MDKRQRANKEAFEAIVKVAMHNGEPGIVNDGTYELPTLEPTSGKWYFVLECPTCANRTAVFHDPAEGKFLTTFSGNGHVRATCAHCEVKMILSPEQLRRIQWP